MSEQGRSTDSIETWKQQTDAVPTEYKPTVVFIDIVQAWYRRESLHCVPTVFLLRPYCVTIFIFLPRERYVHTTLYKTTLRLFHVRPVLNTSVVRLEQVLIASMARSVIEYK